MTYIRKGEKLMRNLMVLMFLVTGSLVYGQNPWVSDKPVTDDNVYGQLEKGALKLLSDGKTIPFKTLAGELDRTNATFTAVPISKKNLTGAEVYRKCTKGVLVMGTIFKCTNCPSEQLRMASGFIISEDGIAVTSYHIFRGQATNENTDVSVVAMDVDGNVFPVTEVIAADATDDIAVFKLDTHGKKLNALPLGNNLKTGEEINVIGHPHNMFYSFSAGYISRYYEREGGTKMSVTADFSQGSSGGPVFDEKGNIAGIVSSTRSLYNTDKHLQMVSREVIPVNALKRLLK